MPRAILFLTSLLSACAAAPAPSVPRAQPRSAAEPPARGPSRSWAIRIGGAFHETEGSLAVDENGDVYVAGQYVRSTDLGAGPVPSLGMQDILLVSYDRDGAYRWSRRVGSRGGDRAWALSAAHGRVVAQGMVDFVRDFGRGRTESEEEHQTYAAWWSTAGEPLGEASGESVMHATLSAGGRLVLVRQSEPGALTLASESGDWSTALSGVVSQIVAAPGGGFVLAGPRLQVADSGETPRETGLVRIGPEGQVRSSQSRSWSMLHAVSDEDQVLLIERRDSVFHLELEGEPSWRVPLGARDAFGRCHAAFVGDAVALACDTRGRGTRIAADVLSARDPDAGEAAQSFLAVFARSDGSVRSVRSLGPVTIRGLSASEQGVVMLLEGAAAPAGLDVTPAGGSDLYLVRLAHLDETNPPAVAGRAPRGTTTAGADEREPFFVLPPLASAPPALPPPTESGARVLEELRVRANAEHGVDVFPDGFAFTAAPDGRRFVHYSYVYSTVHSWAADLRARGRWEATERRARRLGDECDEARERNNARWERIAARHEARGNDEAANRARDHGSYYDPNGPDYECDGWRLVYADYRTAVRCAPDALVYVVHALDADGELGPRESEFRTTTCRMDVDAWGEDLVEEVPTDVLPLRMPSGDFDGDGAPDVVMARRLDEEGDGPDRFSYRALPRVHQVRIVGSAGADLGVVEFPAWPLVDDPYAEPSEEPSTFTRWWFDETAPRGAVRSERVTFDRRCRCSEILSDPEWGPRIGAGRARPWWVERSDCEPGPPVRPCGVSGEPDAEVLFEVPAR